MNKSTLLVTLAGLKGAPAACLLALLLADDALTAGDLEMITGYSGVTIARAAALLHARQLVFGDGVQGFRATLAELHDSPSRGVHGFRALLAELHDSPTSDNRLSAHSPPRDPPGDVLAKKFFLTAPSSSSSRDQLTLQNDEEEEERPQARKILRLLASQGIGPRSRKAQEIASLGLDLAFVQAHVAAREAALAQGESYPPAWLITKLLDGDPAPAPRPCQCGQCEECRQRLYAKYPTIKR